MRAAGFIFLSGIVVSSVATSCGNDDAGDAAAGASGSGGAATNVTMADAGPDTPAGPMRIPNVGGEISFEARGFMGAYCALFEPCCTVGGLLSRCAGRVGAGALAGSYDPSAGEACLAAVRRRQTNPDFCAGLERPTGVELDTSWAAVPECVPVFVPAGLTPPGGACASDAECAAGANGAAFCFTSGTCVQTSRSPGDRCFGDFQRDLLSRALTVYDGATPNVFLCDNDRQLHCDSTTRTCVAIQARALGASCSSDLDCDAASYCSLTSSTCATRLPLGATCMTSAECQVVCDLTTLRCANALPSGAACSGDVGLCGTGNCIDSRCSSLLPSVCGG
ncbi:MAG: hypothetical protein ABI895_00280 [Deltaproteobacteria bacterium]